MMNTNLDQLHDQHGELGQKLQSLQHRKDCAGKAAALEVEIPYTRLDILKLAKAIHEARFGDAMT